MWRGFSWKFRVISHHNSTWWQFGPNPHRIPWHLYRFYLWPMLEHDIMDFVQVQVMKFPWHLLRKWWDFHRISSHFRTKPNCSQKDMRNRAILVVRTRTSIVFDWQGFLLIWNQVVLINSQLVTHLNLNLSWILVNLMAFIYLMENGAWARLASSRICFPRINFEIESACSALVQVKNGK